jgi:hypothetical protein
MSFPITCTGCQAKLRVQKNPAGRKWKCPVCATKFWVPKTAAVVEVMPVEELPTPSPPPLPSQTSRFRKKPRTEHRSPVRFTIVCPKCQGELDFDEDPAGAMCICPLCQNWFVVPEMLPEVEDFEE